MATITAYPLGVRLLGIKALGVDASGVTKLFPTIPAILRGLRTTVVGDSTVMSNLPTQSWWEYATLLAKGKIVRVSNYGTNGATSADVISSQLTLAIAEKADACLVGVGINDILNAVSVATLQANLTTIYDTLMQYGKMPIMASILANASTTTVRDNIALMNTWIEGQARVRGAAYIDNYSPYVTATGATNTTVSGDSIHATGGTFGSGASTIGTNVVTQLDWVTAETPLAYNDFGNHIGQFIDNALSLPGTATAIPTGWTRTDAAGTAPTYSRTAGTGIESLVNIVSADSAHTSTFTLHTARTVASGLVAVGDRLAFACRLQITGAGTNFQYIPNIYMTGGTPSQIPPWGIGYPFMGNVADSILYYEVIVPTGTTAVQAVFWFQGIGTIRIGRQVLMNLTKLGIV